MVKVTRSVLVFLTLISFSFVFPQQRVFAGNPPDAAQSTLTATSAGSDNAPADGTTTTSMTLTLKDSGGVALAGDDASLSTVDSTAVISPTHATLDSNGQAVFTITSTTVGTDSLNAIDHSTGDTTLSALGQVTFTVVPTPTPQPVRSPDVPQCTNTFPKNAPNLYQVTPNDTSVMLYFVQPEASVFDGYTISYGLSQNADTYNASFKQGSSTGAIQYSIQNLYAKTTYYFKVRANNGCAPGPWSSVMSSESKPTQLPISGPANNIFITIGSLGIVTLLGGVSMMFFL